MSDSIYQNKPYTYLIKFIPTGQVYYGVRFAKGCHPDEFWQDGGYFTSSKIVHQLIEEYGSEWFEYEIRQVFDDVNKARDWEEQVLKRMNAVESKQWLNRTDNRSFIRNKNTYTIKEQNKKEQTFIKKYGCKNPNMNAEVKEKKKQTYLKKYGVDNYSKTEECKEKTIKTNLEKYGVIHPMCLTEFEEKRIMTCNKKYGVDHPMQSETVKKKSREKCLEKYGVQYHTQTPEARERTRKMNAIKYRCNDCGLETNIGALKTHQKYKNHSGFEEV